MKKMLIAIFSLFYCFATFSASALAADAQKGKRVWMKCRACHTLDEGGANRIGPNLFGVVGREAGKIEGFRYSKPMSEAGISWTEENIKTYLANPRTFIKGTKMTFAGIRKPEQIDDLIAYIKEQSGQN